MKKMLRTVANPSGIDKDVFTVIATLRAETYDEIHAIEPYTIESAITALQNRATVDESSISTLQGQMTTALGDISSIDGRVTVTENELATLDVTFILAFIAYFISYQSNAAGDYHSNNAGDYRIHQRL
jgi:hypothetical protein